MVKAGTTAAGGGGGGTLTPLLVIVMMMCALVTGEASGGRASSAIANTHACTQQHVLAVSTGRTGSTLLMRALAAFEAAFAIPEPFRAWMEDAHAPDVPSYSSLFTCDFLHDADVTRKVFWEYACTNNRVIVRHSPLLQRCKQGQMTADDRKHLFHACSRTCVKVIKTIRFNRFPLTNAETKQLQDLGNLNVLHIVRQPWLAVESKYKSGWKYQPTVEGMGRALLQECQIMLGNAEHAQALAASPVHTIWHEQLVSNMTESLTSILLHLRWNMHSIHVAVPDLVTHLHKHKFADLHRQGLRPIRITEQQALRWLQGRGAQERDACVKAYAAFNYTYPDLGELEPTEHTP